MADDLWPNPLASPNPDGCSAECPSPLFAFDGSVRRLVSKPPEMLRSGWTFIS